jgi:hypothetical protein
MGGIETAVNVNWIQEIKSRDEIRKPAFSQTANRDGRARSAGAAKIVGVRSAGNRDCFSKLRFEAAIRRVPDRRVSDRGGLSDFPPCHVV